MAGATSWWAWSSLVDRKLQYLREKSDSVHEVTELLRNQNQTLEQKLELQTERTEFLEQKLDELTARFERQSDKAMLDSDAVSMDASSYSSSVCTSMHTPLGALPLVPLDPDPKAPSNGMSQTSEMAVAFVFRASSSECIVSRRADCIRQCVHTGAFTAVATREDFHSSWKIDITTPDGAGSCRFISRLQAMNIPISNHWNKGSGTLDNGTLDKKFCDLAGKGFPFTLSWHQGGKTNAYACTSIICNHCLAKLVVDHPGLPAKAGQLQDSNLVKKVNEQVVQFLFTEQEIEEQELLDRIVCTAERHFP